MLLSRPSRHATENEYWPIVIIIFHRIWFKSLLSSITTLKPSIWAANKVVIARKGSNVTLIPPCQEGYISYNLRLLGNQRTRIISYCFFYLFLKGVIALKPKISEVDKAVVARKGSIVTLMCSATRVRKLTTSSSWKFNGQELKKRKQQNNNTRATLSDK